MCVSVSMLVCVCARTRARVRGGGGGGGACLLACSSRQFLLIESFLLRIIDHTLLSSRRFQLSDHSLISLSFSLSFFRSFSSSFSVLFSFFFGHAEFLGIPWHHACFFFWVPVSSQHHRAVSFTVSLRQESWKTSLSGQDLPFLPEEVSRCLIFCAERRISVTRTNTFVFQGTGAKKSVS